MAALTTTASPDVQRMREALSKVRDGLYARLNDYLCDMREGYDDSIVGFNEAWDVMRKYFDDKLTALQSAEAESPVTGEVG